MGKIGKISPTLLSTLFYTDEDGENEPCTMRFPFRYPTRVEGFPKVAAPETLAFVLGRVVHGLCKDFYKIKWKSQETFRNTFFRRWEAAIADEWINEEKGEEPTKGQRIVEYRGGDGKEKRIVVGTNTRLWLATEDDRIIELYRMLMNAGAAMVWNYWSYLTRDTPKEKLIVPLAMERSYGFPWRGHNLVGKLDRVDEGKGGVVVTDYKTGARSPTAEEMGKDYQLTMYWIAGQRVFKRVSRIIYYDLRHDERYIMTRGSTDFDNLERLLVQASQIVNDEAFELSIGDHCRTCQYRELCVDRFPQEHAPHLPLPPYY